ncbi:MAG: sugar transferase [Planctomycetes bacterium]|nr:sugar transferase [Planctomycetota bacterium]
MQSTRHTRLTGLALDVGCLAAALFAAGAWSPRVGNTAWQTTYEGLAHVLLFATVWTFCSSRLGTYTVSVRRDPERAFRSLLEAWPTTWGVAGLIAVTTLQHPHLSIWLTLVYGLALLAVARLVLLGAPTGAIGGRRRALVVGASRSARALSAGKHTHRDMEFVGFVPFAGDDQSAMPHLEQVGSLADLEDTLARHRCDIALVCPTEQSVTGDVHRVFRSCDQAGIGIHYFPPFLDLEHLRAGFTWSGSRQGITLHSEPNQSIGQLAKRAIDVVGATVGICALLPVFGVCAVLTKMSSPGPVFFRQKRVGKNGEVFTCLKFRTMRVGAQAQQELLRAASIQDGPALKVKDDPRVTKSGRILRKFSLDELPQLFNVLLGDMSLVGPRPPIPSEVEKYSWWQRRRISVKPGLTCVWQVWGRNRVSFKRWVEMDLFYIDNWSLWLDIKLIAHTFRAVLKGTGM